LSLENGERIFVPERTMEKVKEEISRLSENMAEVPRFLRGAIKRATREISPEDWAEKTLLQIVESVHSWGGKIIWEE